MAVLWNILCLATSRVCPSMLGRPNCGGDYLNDAEFFNAYLDTEPYNFSILPNLTGVIYYNVLNLGSLPFLFLSSVFMNWFFYISFKLRETYLFGSFLIGEALWVYGEALLSW